MTLQAPKAAAATDSGDLMPALFVLVLAAALGPRPPQDATITFGQDLSPRAMVAIERLPGVSINRNGGLGGQTGLNVRGGNADLNMTLAMSLKRASTGRQTKTSSTRSSARIRRRSSSMVGSAAASRSSSASWESGIASTSTRVRSPMS